MKLPQEIIAYIDCYKASNSHSHDGKIYELILVLGVITLSLGNVFAKKVVSVFGFEIALSGVIFPFIFLFLTIINEVYGHQKCGRAIVAMLFGQLFFLLLMWQFSLIPSPQLTSTGNAINQSLQIAFGAYGQVIVGSMLAVGLSFYFFSILNSSIKVKLCKFNPILRYLVSVGIAKAILVVIAYSFNLSGVATSIQIVEICIDTWIFKMFMALFVIAISLPIIHTLKKVEETDIYDVFTSYNPFYLYSRKSNGMNLYCAIENSRGRDD